MHVKLKRRSHSCVTLMLLSRPNVLLNGYLDHVWLCVSVLLRDLALDFKVWTSVSDDAPFHLSEECSNSQIATPRAIVLTSFLGGTLGWFLCLVLVRILPAMFILQHLLRLSLVLRRMFISLSCN
jgi:hypothetical protein